MRRYYHRIVAVAATHGRRLALALVLVGLLVAGATAWHAATPAYETVSETTTVDAATTEVNTSALVTGESSFYRPGTRVRSAPVYLLDPAPVMTLRATARVPADRDIVVSQRILVSYVASHDDAVFWRSNRTVVERSATVSDGRAGAVGTLDVTDVRDRLGDLNDELAGAGTVGARIVHVTTYRVDGHEHRLTSSAPLRVSGRSYSVDGSLSASTDHTVESTERQLATTGHYATTVAGRQVVVDDAALAGMLFAVLAWIGAGATVRYGPRIDPAAARQREVAASYDEWISDGRLPATHTGPAVRLDSLPDLIDVAIDTRGRVVHDETKGMYAVFDGERAYYFADGAGAGWADADAFEWGDANSSNRSDTNGDAHTDMTFSEE